jgi:cytochrome c
MTFAGLEVAQDRANIIAWLNTQGSNLPLPKAPAAVAPAVGPIGGPADGKPAAAPSEAAKK